jgi:adenosine/AMP kinase
MLEFKTVKIQKPSEDTNVILGQSHFIKTVEDIYETMVNSVPRIRFGLAFSESSGACKIRTEGSDLELKKSAAENALAVGCGHFFIVMIRDAYPVNVLNALKNVPEVCSIYCASANPLEVVVAETGNGRGVMGVIDGAKPAGIENEEDAAWRKDLLRQIGYKR